MVEFRFLFFSFLFLSRADDSPRESPVMMDVEGDDRKKRSRKKAKSRATPKISTTPQVVGCVVGCRRDT